MLKTEVQIPEGVNASLAESMLNVRGAKGEIRKEFRHPLVSITLVSGKIILASETEKKKVKAIVGTWEAIIKNMLAGVTKSWKGELKLVYSHFPVKLKVEAGKLIIDNFLGEKSPRTVSVPADMKVEIDKNAIYVSGPDKEKVGRMCGRIEQATRVSGYDKRVFQDGIYITRKPFLEGEE